jgi:hypothetical protein
MYKPGSRKIGVASERGSAGTNRDPALFEQERDRDIAWLFRGRKPDEPRPAGRIVIKSAGWRGNMRQARRTMD